MLWLRGDEKVCCVLVKGCVGFACSLVLCASGRKKSWETEKRSRRCWNKAHDGHLVQIRTHAELLQSKVINELLSRSKNTAAECESECVCEREPNHIQKIPLALSHTPVSLSRSLALRQRPFCSLSHRARNTPCWNFPFRCSRLATRNLLYLHWRVSRNHSALLSISFICIICQFQCCTYNLQS